MVDAQKLLDQFLGTGRSYGTAPRPQQRASAAAAVDPGHVGQDARRRARRHRRAFGRRHRRPDRRRPVRLALGLGLGLGRLVRGRPCRKGDRRRAGRRPRLQDPRRQARQGSRRLGAQARRPRAGGGPRLQGLAELPGTAAGPWRRLQPCRRRPPAARRDSPRRRHALPSRRRHRGRAPRPPAPVGDDRGRQGRRLHRPRGGGKRSSAGSTISISTRGEGPPHGRDAPADVDRRDRGPGARRETAIEVYTASVLAIDADHPAERAYLDYLAARLDLPAESSPRSAARPTKCRLDEAGRRAPSLPHVRPRPPRNLRAGDPQERFVAKAAPIDTEADARRLLSEWSDPAATHNCWAWRIGNVYRFSDDGEPGGTAGKPILQAIDGQDLDGALVVVTRGTAASSSAPAA